MLDMFGYQSDKLKKKSNDMNNIINDANHTFYATYCDLFIAEDKNLIKKAKAIYSNKNLSTRVFNVEEFIENIDEIFPKSLNSFQELFNKHALFTNENYLLETQHDIENLKYIFKLPALLFDFFNRLFVRVNKKDKSSEYTYKRENRNYSNLSFPGEKDTLIKNIIYMFGRNDEKTFSDIKQLIFVERKSVFLYNDGIVSAVLYEDNSEIYFRYYIKSNDENNME